MNYQTYFTIDFFVILETLDVLQTGSAAPQIASAVPDTVGGLEKESYGMLVRPSGGLVPMVYRT